MEREAPHIAIAPTGLAVSTGAERAGGVLDDEEAHLVGEGHDVAHRGRIAERVDRHDGSRVHGHGRLQMVRARGERGRVDVREAGLCPGLLHGVGRCREGEGRHHDVITGAHTEGVQGEVQRGRTRRGRHREVGADRVGHPAFEGGDHRTLGEVSGAKHAVDGGELGVAKGGIGETDSLVAHNATRSRDRYHSTVWARPAIGANPRLEPDELERQGAGRAVPAHVGRSGRTVLRPKLGPGGFVDGGDEFVHRDLRSGSEVDHPAPGSRMLIGIDGGSGRVTDVDEIARSARRRRGSAWALRAVPARPRSGSRRHRPRRSGGGRSC